MDTYVNEYMRKSLAKHVFEPQLDGCLRMGVPGDCVYVVYIAEFANRICITGDVCIGTNDNGLISNVGYKLSWFSKPLSECYLCEKFLRQEWQWEAAVEQMEWQIKIDTEDDTGWWLEHSKKLKKFIASPGWKYEEPTIGEFYEFMTDELDGDGCELPGSDYPRIQAGWLCAIQQRFVELIQNEGL